MLKRRTGGKNRGRMRGGRRAWAVIRAARAVGGTGDSVRGGGSVRAFLGNWGGGGVGGWGGGGGGGGGGGA